MSTRSRTSERPSPFASHGRSRQSRANDGGGQISVIRGSGHSGTSLPRLSEANASGTPSVLVAGGDMPGRVATPTRRISFGGAGYWEGGSGAPFENSTQSAPVAVAFQVSSMPEA